MVLGGAPKTAGRKPSTRKISNRKIPSTTSLVDLLEGCDDQLEQSSNQSDLQLMQISTAHPVNLIIIHNDIISHHIILFKMIFIMMSYLSYHLLFNKIINSHRYKETVSFLNG